MNINTYDDGLKFEFLTAVVQQTRNTLYGTGFPVMQIRNMNQDVNSWESRSQKEGMRIALHEQEDVYYRAD